jgi:anti-anti-sigma regulatory factor
MTTHAVCIPVDPKCPAQTLQHEAVEKLQGAEGELVLDFSSVMKIDAAAAGAMEELADLADRQSASVALRGVNIAIYRALKLLKLAPRFSFLE